MAINDGSQSNLDVHVKFILTGGMGVLLEGRLDAEAQCSMLMYGRNGEAQ